ncbi:thiol reductant ABC exporter subunit CydC [Cellulomonas aerilata]|uniref:Thiol reductant ABC exporter subunit CydC n=1 Tax=Cellulomonas aerilata TaxID=515326 RepID=A0A512DCA3_9CELL|nr:thiol reductant ABC exporter subunit CydC [Cellulomonas aerilata]GEO34086.1 thiol reductant ABC exporter subunit CydC [Cellulomonas aerilata]
MTSGARDGRTGPTRAILRLVDRRRAALGVALGAGTVLSGTALLAVSGALITRASQHPEDLFVLLPLITSVRLFGISRAALRYAERLVSHDVTLRLVGSVRDRLLRALVPLAPAALSGARSGELLGRIRADVDELQGAVVRLLAPAVVALLAGGLAVAAVALVSPGLAAVHAVLLTVLGVAVPLWTRHRSRHTVTAAARAEEAFGSDLLDLVRGMADHLSGDGGRTATATLRGHIAAQGEAEHAQARTTRTAVLLRELVPGVGVVAALWLVGSDVADGRTHPALLAAAALAVLGSFEAVAGLGAAWTTAEAVRAAAHRVQALQDLRPAVTDPHDPQDLPPGTELRLEHVTFTYPGARRPALLDLDLTVAPGDKVALCGVSGAGKSTVLSLAMRSRDPDAGRVTLGGVDVRRLALDDVRRQFAWAPQSPQVLGGTLAGNLRLAGDDVTDHDLTTVLVHLGLGDVLGAVGPDGWIGESGDRLSAGERARLGLARALLSDAPVLLVDEPTAHLDRPLAAHVMRVLAADPRSVLVVSHDTELLDATWRRVDVVRPLVDVDPAPAAGARAPEVHVPDAHGT